MDFNGVRYNTSKINKGLGELMAMKNFPTLDKNSTQEDVKNYLKSLSNNNFRGKSRIKNPQFHAVISTKFQKHSKEELTKIAEEVMKELGYGAQPYIVVFHNDTDNNHVHIVSSRVDKNTGKKIDDSFEKLKSQRALSNVLEKLYDIKVERELDLLLKYDVSSINQLKILLEKEGFKFVSNQNDSNEFFVLKNGVKQKSLKADKLNFKSSGDTQRKKQLKAIFYKYKDKYSNKVFRVIDDRDKNGRLNEPEKEKAEIKVDFDSEFQHNLRKLFGLDIVFHNKDDKDPFGYSIIDHKTGAVFKGSEIMKMQELFEFTTDSIDKKTFEKLKAYNTRNDDERKCLINYLKKHNIDVKDFMLFHNKGTKNINDYSELKKEVIDFIQHGKHADRVTIEQTDDGRYFAINSKYHHIQELKSLVGDSVYAEFINPNQNENYSENKMKSEGIGNIIDNVLHDFSKSEFGKKDPFEDDLLKKKQKKKRK